MVAIEELRTELEAKFDINTMVKDITTRLSIDIGGMDGFRGGFSEGVNFVGLDETAQCMVKLGLIRTVRSPFNPGSYSYTPKARDLYAKLQEEKYYEIKTE